MTANNPEVQDLKEKIDQINIAIRQLESFGLQRSNVYVKLTDEKAKLEAKLKTELKRESDGQDASPRQPSSCCNDTGRQRDSAGCKRQTPRWPPMSNACYREKRRRINKVPFPKPHAELGM